MKTESTPKATASRGIVSVYTDENGTSQVWLKQSFLLAYISKDNGGYCVTSDVTGECEQFAILDEAIDRVLAGVY
jgi:hypothetical protein